MKDVNVCTGEIPNFNRKTDACTSPPSMCVKIPSLKRQADLKKVGSNLLHYLGCITAHECINLVQFFCCSPCKSLYLSLSALQGARSEQDCCRIMVAVNVVLCVVEFSS